MYFSYDEEGNTLTFSGAKSDMIIAGHKLLSIESDVDFDDFLDNKKPTTMKVVTLDDANGQGLEIETVLNVTQCCWGIDGEPIMVTMVDGTEWEITEYDTYIRAEISNHAVEPTTEAVQNAVHDALNSYLNQTSGSVYHELNGREIELHFNANGIITTTITSGEGENETEKDYRFRIELVPISE